MNWKKHYESCGERLVKRISKSPPIVTGFNANIDAVNYVDEELLKKLGQNYSQRKSVRSLADLGRGIRESISLGEANEWELENENIYDNILDLGYDEARMGGQAGIVTNLMARMGVEVRVLLPVLAEEQAKYFVNRNVKIATIKNQYFTLTKPSQAFDENVDARINCIFEFKRGFMKAPRANRFILSYRPQEHEPRLNERIILNSNKIFQGVKRAFISGYQLFDSEADFRRGVDQLRTIKTFTKGTKFHLEMTNVESAKLRRNILKIGREFDSVGCNDVELELLTGTDQIVNGMRLLVKKTGVQRLHVHTFKNHFCLLKKEYGISAEKERDCMMMGAVMASAKAGLGEIKHKSDVLRARNKLTGLDYLRNIESEDGIIEMNNYYIIVIPNLLSKRVKSTVGLGDSISSTAFVSEVI